MSRLPTGSGTHLKNVSHGVVNPVWLKIEVHHPSLGRPSLFLQDKSVIAIACDVPLSVPTDLPILDLNYSLEIFEFIQQQFLNH